MSNRARLILLSGVGGAGTTTLCAATAAALEAEGLRVSAVDAGATDEPDAAVVSLLTASLGRLGAELGADPLIVPAWYSWPAVTALSALQRMSQALSDASSDVVVVDAGPLSAARSIVDVPAAATRLLDAVMTPRLAMWRTSGPTGGETVFESLSALRLVVLGWAKMLQHPATTVRLVTTPDEGAVRRTARALGAVALLGVGVDGIIVNKYPRKSDGWPKAVRRGAEDALHAMSAAADGVEVWTSTARIRPVPKGRSAMGPIGRVHVLDAEQLVVTVGDEDFRLDVPLAGPARTEARVGRQADQLVVQFDGATRWIDLPPVLRRCRAVEATRTQKGLAIRFAPDPAMWRQPEVAS